MKASWRKRRKSRRTTVGSQPSSIVRVLTLLAVVLVCAGLVDAQTKPKKGEPQTRTLKGVVTSIDGKPVSHAAVLLENTKTKLIVSFYSEENGSYFFHELNPDVDYKVTARQGDQSSATHTLSSFDSRREAVINLKLEQQKK
jgi:hypothetical protein